MAQTPEQQIYPRSRIYEMVCVIVAVFFVFYLGVIATSLYVIKKANEKINRGLFADEEDKLEEEGIKKRVPKMKAQADE